MTSVSDSSLLRRPAAVVGQRGDVLDPHYLESGALEMKDGLLAAGAGAFHLHLDLHQAMLAGGGGGGLGGAAGGKRRALARALDPALACRRPRQRLAVGVSDRDDRVVERRLDVRDAARHALTNLLLRRRLLGAGRGFC